MYVVHQVYQFHKKYQHFCLAICNVAQWNHAHSLIFYSEILLTHTFTWPPCIYKFLTCRLHGYECLQWCKFRVNCLQCISCCSKITYVQINPHISLQYVILLKAMLHTLTFIQWNILNTNYYLTPMDDDVVTGI